MSLTEMSLDLDPGSRDGCRRLIRSIADILSASSGYVAGYLIARVMRTPAKSPYAAVLLAYTSRLRQVEPGSDPNDDSNPILCSPLGQWTRYVGSGLSCRPLKSGEASLAPGQIADTKIGAPSIRYYPVAMR
jgi:hypothetical protein